MQAFSKTIDIFLASIFKNKNSLHHQNDVSRFYYFTLMLPLDVSTLISASYNPLSL